LRDHRIQLLAVVVGVADRDDEPNEIAADEMGRRQSTAGTHAGEFAMTSIKQDLVAYEKWLGEQCDVVAADLDLKHRRMRKSGFDFLRATYFRWALTIETLCRRLASAPQVLCIGDIHIENYGTWRDADARLVWGINDFDEAAVMPYTFDLLRLTTSATLAPDLQLSAAAVSAAILKGYRSGLKKPRAVLLDEDGGALRSYANPSGKSNRDFWQEVKAYADADPPDQVRKSLTAALPEGARVKRFAARSKGGGGLGRPRFLVIAKWNSGQVLREAKALVPSAWAWAHDSDQRSRFLDVAGGAYRSPDPLLRIEGNFILRRIAPDSRKIDFADVQTSRLTEVLLAAMAADLASVHAASEQVDQITADLGQRPDAWLKEACEAAVAATKRDFSAYKALGR
jgi:hypothetical protein